jgi:calcineurin-like phosphoesterase family protein
MTVYVTSDFHFHHQNIITFTGREFSDKIEMNRELLWMWNSTVKQEDSVYFLGDFSMKANATEIRELLKKLAGNIYIVRGNHDKALMRVLDSQGGTWTGGISKPIWHSKEFPNIKVIRDIYELKIDDQTFVMCHYPMHSWNHMYHGNIHLHGHVHGHTPLEVIKKGSNRYYRIDVGYDANKKLLSYEDIMNMVNKNKNKSTYDI